MNKDLLVKKLIKELEDLIFYTRLFDWDNDKDYIAYEQRFNNVVELAANFMEGTPLTFKGRPKRKIIDLDTLLVFDDAQAAADFAYCGKETVRLVCNGKTKSINGFKFKFLDEYRGEEV